MAQESDFINECSCYILYFISISKVFISAVSALQFVHKRCYKYVIVLNNILVNRKIDQTNGLPMLYAASRID